MRVAKKALQYAILILLALVFMMPFLWMLSTSLKGGADDLFTYPPEIIPRSFHWENYRKVLSMYPWGTFLKNTSLITFTSMFATLLSSAMVAFGFARLRFPGRDKIFFLVLSTMMVPYYTTLIPQYILFSKLGWVNTLMPLIVPNFFGAAFYIFLLRQHFMGIPAELDDSAKIDGAGTMRIFGSIYLPLAKPALITIGILQFMAAWSDFIGPLIYLHSEKNYTLTLALNTFRGIHYTDWHYLMAGTMMVALPSLVFFFVGQNYIIGGITVSGIK